MCYVRYKDIFYKITRIDTYEGYKDDLKLYASLYASQPGAGSIIEWEETKK